MQTIETVSNTTAKGAKENKKHQPQGRSHPALRRCLVAAASVLSAALSFGTVMAAEASMDAIPPANFSRLSIEELINVEISSVSKRPELLSDAAAAIYVITQEDIRRSGATSIPEILRLAPNLQVARFDSSQYAISARGFNSTAANKLLVLIDGRTVYTTLHSGVFWDVQDTLLDDIERIEVSSGPGGTLWGSNAVNGVINIITRNSRDTTGALVSIGGGSDEGGAGVRYGGQLGEDATFRIYAKGFRRDDTVTARGASVQDSWHEQQLGFRIDSRRGSSDALVVEGSAYDGSIDQAINNDKTISGNHLLGRWNHTLGEQSALQIQTYYDQTKRNYPGTFAEVVDTWDVDIQHRFSWTAQHNIIWGGGYRLTRDDVTNSPLLAFLPAQRDLKLFNIFLQDSITLSPRVQLTLGSKLERNSYTGTEHQPNLRLAWKLQDHALLWSSAARAVRTPSRLDRELFSPSQPPFLIAGGPDFKSEKLTAYEIGYRAQPAANISYSLSGFYNVYDELRTIDLQPGGTVLGGPYMLGNKMEGDAHGVEMWGSYRVNDWWRLNAGYNYLKQNFRLEPGSSANNGPQTAGNDPSHQFSARSAMNLAHNVALDVALRAIGDLPNPKVPGYAVLDTRIGWMLAKNTELSLAGFNLLDKRHAEFGTATTRSEFPRTFLLKLLWKL